jgi:hypothetical protein
MHRGRAILQRHAGRIERRGGGTDDSDGFAA